MSLTIDSLTALEAPTSSVQARRTVRRTDRVLVAAAAGLALWLGFAAPSVSPVAPATTAAVVSQAAAPVTAGRVPADPAAGNPGDPQLRGRGGRGR